MSRRVLEIAGRKAHTIYEEGWADYGGLLEGGGVGGGWGRGWYGLATLGTAAGDVSGQIVSTIQAMNPALIKRHSMFVLDPDDARPGPPVAPASALIKRKREDQHTNVRNQEWSVAFDGGHDAAGLIGARIDGAQSTEELAGAATIEGIPKKKYQPPYQS